jgi:hypothetical protein
MEALELDHVAVLEEMDYKTVLLVAPFIMLVVEAGAMGQKVQEILV